MDLKKQKKSANVEQSIRGNSKGKGSNLLYEQKIVKDAIAGASQAFQDKIKGKGDRQNGPDSPLTRYLKAADKQKNIFK